MNYPYDSRTTLVNGSCLTISFLSSLGNGIVDVVGATSSYLPAGKAVFSAERIQRTVAIFDSRPIYLAANVTSWKELLWVGNNPTGTKTYVYVRTAATEALLSSSEWTGPLLNGSGEDISSQTGKTIQFRIAMYSEYNSTTEVIPSPTISSVTASCYVAGTSERFYTSRLNLGFIPKHIILTYNGTVPTDTVVQFAVTTDDETDLSKYKVITPNTVTSIDDIAKTEYLKLAISALGNTEIPFIVDEFAIAIGGDENTRLS
jgi:hypothetical protein